MKKEIKYAILLLEQAQDFIPVDELLIKVKETFPNVNSQEIVKKLKKTIYIGFDKEKGFKWFEWEKQSQKTKDLLLLNEAALARGLDW